MTDSKTNMQEKVKVGRVHRFHIDELRRFVGGGGEVVAR